jgi:DNA invertase Pin-like site-specific DNA recombinase
VREYSDTISGATFGRIGLTKLMSTIRRGKVDAVLVYKLDRLAVPFRIWSRSSMS